MNAQYTEFAPSEAAKIFGTTPQVVTSWCRAGVINYTDVSEARSARPRYAITESEVYRVLELINKYGMRGWVKKVHSSDTNPKEVVALKPQKTSEQVKEHIFKPVFDADKVTDAVFKIQYIKERLENLDAERNQLVNELNSLKKEVMGYLE